MSNSKISALTSATTPLAGTETLPIVQSGATVKATVANITGSGLYPGSFTTLASTGNTTLGDATTDTVQVNGYMGVGGAADDKYGLYVRSSALTGTNQRGILATPTATSAATSTIVGVFAYPITAAAAFTVPNASSFRADDAVKGAGSTITNQHGLYIADQIQGTNNYGITSLVSSGTNKYNIYASGTAQNYFAGNVGIGVAPPTNPLSVTGNANFSGVVGIGGATNASFGISVTNSALTGTSQSGIRSGFTASSAATSDVRGYQAAVNLAAAAFTANEVSSFYASNVGALSGGAAITSQFGLYVGDQTRGTNNYGVYSLVSSGTNKWNVYASGSAQNYFAGNVGVGTTTPTSKLQVSNSSNGTTVDVTIANTYYLAGSIDESVTFQGEFYQNDVAANRAAGYMRVTKTGDFSNNANASANLVFATRNAGSITEKVRIDSAGLVGIGTSAPGALLDVTGVPAGSLSRFLNTTAPTLSNDTHAGEALFLRSGGTAGSGNVQAVLAFGKADGSSIRSGSAIASVQTTADADQVGIGFYTSTSSSSVQTLAQAMLIAASGNVGIGTTSPNASALLDVQSTTKGVRMPNMTTIQKNAIASPAAGLMVFDTTLAKLCVYSGAAWETITSI